MSAGCHLIVFSRLFCGTFLSVFRNMNLRMFAVVAYTPSSATYSAAERLIQFFIAHDLRSCSLRRFSTKGLRNGEPNFVLILAGLFYKMVSFALSLKRRYLPIITQIDCFNAVKKCDYKQVLYVKFVRDSLLCMDVRIDILRERLETIETIHS